MKAVVVLLCLAVAACSSTGERQSLGPDLAHAAGWNWETLDGGSFRLASAVAPMKPSAKLVVYLEGDGFAYVRPSQPSQNPTPTDPVALRLALAAPTRDANLAWLGRPCQYIDSSRCDSAYWTGWRYAPEVLDSMNMSIDQIKSRSHANQIVLVGYSGGGAIAVLLAARRGDVKGVVTVAANLDLGYWTRRDGLAPLAGSLDPADIAPSLGAVPQVHFTGGRDKTVGTDVVRSFMARLPSGTPARLIEISDYTHACCWARDWPRLAAEME
ncbi:MAG TPA: alpha/beta hydrolase [Candidatus Sulfotelmatobacter sp.]|jgi:pimeloyl-ACP methyl ester carboxylesterase|nr:alpha/beta hydrolase [Candidatus Sulfotelmatobacter sp.]